MSVCWSLCIKVVARADLMGFDKDLAIIVFMNDIFVRFPVEAIFCFLYRNLLNVTGGSVHLLIQCVQEALFPPINQPGGGA
jgi:hypothetical protein